MFPERFQWDTPTLLLGRAVDALNLLVWSKTKAARHNWGRPKSVIPWGRKEHRKGSKPKAAPLSTVRARMAKLHARRGPRSLTGPPKSREQKIKDIFKD